MSTSTKPEPIFATRRINVHGTLYQAGEEIKCGPGSRKSLLQFRQATTATPSARPHRGPSKTLEGQTPLDALKLSAPAARALDKMGIVSVEQLDKAIKKAGGIEQLEGIGSKLAAELRAAREQLAAATT